MAQAVDCDLHLYPDDSCSVYVGNDVNVIENNHNRNFNSLCNWVVEKKLTIYFGEDNTKAIIFCMKSNLKRVHQLDIWRGEIKIKRHPKYCTLDVHSGERNDNEGFFFENKIWTKVSL